MDIEAATVVAAVLGTTGWLLGRVSMRRRLARMRWAAELLLETVRYDSQDRRMPMEPDCWECSCSPLDEDDMRRGCPRCRLVRAGLLPPDPARPRGPVSPDDDIPF